MAGETIITIVGNVCSEVDLKFTPSGAAVANFRVASTPRQFDKQANAWKDMEPMFLGCNVWREMAESVAESVTKGMRVIVTGRLRCRAYETREGEKRQSWELEVDEIGPSLKYATAKVQKMARSGGAQSSSGGQAAGGDPWASAAPAASGSTGDDSPPF